ncbi:MAG: hypothetical protein M3173_00760 [Chloroflexota bacterium]|nr:hypothetical protein [Chloroflexota bacterium]
MLPAELAGFNPTKNDVLRLGSFENPRSQVALDGAGFRYGAKREFQNGATRVEIAVFQFGSERGALRFEAERFASLCAERQRGLALPAGTGAAGIVFSREAEDDRRRLSFIRGSRTYIIFIDGRDFSGHAELLLGAIAVAR